MALQDNDSDRVDLAVNVSGLGEGDGATSVTVTGTLRINQVASLPSAIEVPLGIGADSTATSGAGNDYTVSSDTLTFASGATSGATVSRTLTVTPNDDSVVANVETIVITGTPAGILNAVTNAPAINLNDNDVATVSIGRGRHQRFEGASATFTATLSAQVATAVTVAWSAGADDDANSADANPDDDLVAKSGSVVFAGGQRGRAAQTISVSIRNDELSEGDETFRVTLGAITGAPPARGGPPRPDGHGAWNPRLRRHHHHQERSADGGAGSAVEAAGRKGGPVHVARARRDLHAAHRSDRHRRRRHSGHYSPDGAPSDTGCPANADICRGDDGQDGMAFPGGGSPSPSRRERKRGSSRSGSPMTEGATRTRR